MGIGEAAGRYAGEGVSSSLELTRRASIGEGLRTHTSWRASLLLPFLLLPGLRAALPAAVAKDDASTSIDSSAGVCRGAGGATPPTDAVPAAVNWPSSSLPSSSSSSSSEPMAAPPWESKRVMPSSRRASTLPSRAFFWLASVSARAAFRVRSARSAADAC